MNTKLNTADPVQLVLAAKKTYTVPKLEQHQSWVISTGVTTPFNTLSGDFLEEQP